MLGQNIGFLTMVTWLIFCWMYGCVCVFIVSRIGLFSFSILLLGSLPSFPSVWKVLFLSDWIVFGWLIEFTTEIIFACKFCVGEGLCISVRVQPWISRRCIKRCSVSNWGLARSLESVATGCEEGQARTFSVKGAEALLLGLFNGLNQWAHPDYPG